LRQSLCVSKLLKNAESGCESLGLTMKGPKLLGVMLKAIGIWCFVGGMSGLPHAIKFWGEYPDEQAFLMMMADTFAGPGILIISSWFLIRATDWFVGIAYPATIVTNDNAPNDESAPELFGVILKAMGYWEIINGAIRSPYEFARAYRSTGVGFFDGLAYSGIVIISGCFLIFTTDWFVQFAYRKAVAIDDEETRDEPPPGSSKA
jgi:hypothetical protein